MMLGKLCKIGVLSLSIVTLVACQNNDKQSSSASAENNLVRETKFGKVKGANNDGVLTWKGVPYGGSVSNSNRWKAPTDPEKWSGELDATKDGAVAVQLSGGEVVGEEDALNLDIYRPDSDKKDLPVLVYVHGGNNQTGKSTELSGSSFVKNHDAIFVSVNYRLGALGFNPLEALKTGTDEEKSGNFTLLDIAKSLDWVRNNISEFGGNSKNVTLSGFSAGGRDVMATLISPVFKGKYDKAISFSGGMTVSDTNKSQEVFAEALAPLAVEDGKASDTESTKQWLLTSGSDVRDYLYSLDSKRLAPLMGNAGIRMSVFPHLYTDGAVLPKDGFDTKNYNDVPLLSLTGRNEFSLFAYFDKYFADAVKNQTMNAEPASSEYAFVNKYGGELYSLSNTQEPIQKLVSNGYKSPIYATEVQFGENPDVVGQQMATFGSFHGVFVPLFDKDNQNYSTLVGDGYSSNGVKDLSDKFQDYIFNFISAGNPNGKGLVDWQAWSTGKNSIFSMDASKDEAIFKMVSKDFDYDTVLKEIESDSTVNAEQKQSLILEVLNGRWFSHKLDDKYNNLSTFDK